MDLMKIKPSFKFSEKYLLDIDDDYKKIMIADYKFYLSEMMMLKIDRASMANSLEIRSPFVDHRLIEYILSSNMKTVFDTGPKKILKEYLSEDFNSQFTERKKMGFAFNLEEWIFNNQNIIKEFFNNGKVVNKVDNNIVNKLSKRKTRLNSHRIWKLFLLEVYLENAK